MIFSRRKFWLLLLLLTVALLNMTNFLIEVVHNSAFKPRYINTIKTSLMPLPKHHIPNLPQSSVIKHYHTKKVTIINIASNLNTNVTRVNTTEDNKTFVNIQHNNITEAGPDPEYFFTQQLITKIINNIENQVTTEGVIKKSESTLPLCDAMPPDLGPIPVNTTELELDFVDSKYPEVHWGGLYSPPNCTARHRVAIIVPYRDRRQNLAIFLNNIHPFLMKQQLEYGIFIVEQEGNRDFNRAKLQNVGFVEAQRLKAGGWQCFIFHDVDLLPTDTRNLYSCPRQPRHMSASVDKLNFRLLYPELFGGVFAMTLEQFKKVNGFSNKYWGWGGEDDDMAYRIQEMNYQIARYKMSIARYVMLDHKQSAHNPKRYRLLSKTSKVFQLDGLSTLKYKLVQVAQKHLYTHLLANVDEPIVRTFGKLLFGDKR